MLTVRRDELLRSVSLACEAVPNKPVNPVLGNVHLLARDRLHVEATDTEISIASSCAITDLDAHWEALVPASLFHDILRLSRDEELFLDLCDQKVTITGPRTEATLAVADPAGWPEVEFDWPPGRHLLPADSLSRLLDLTAFAAATAGVRYAINGVLFYLEREKATLVATDRRVMSIAEVPAVSEGGHHTTGSMTVIPQKAAKLLARCINRANGEISVAFSKSNCNFSGDNWSLGTRLLDGQYPAFKFVQEARSLHTCKIDPQEFLACLKQVSILQTVGKLFSPTSLRFSEGRLEMQIRGDVGHTRVFMDIDGGAPVEMTINAELVLQMLPRLLANRTTDGPIELSYSDKQKPLYFRDQGYTYMVALIGAAEEKKETKKEES